MYVKAVCKRPYTVQVHASQMSLNIDDFHNLQYNRTLIFLAWFNNIMLITFFVCMSKS